MWCAGSPAAIAQRLTIVLLIHVQVSWMGWRRQPGESFTAQIFNMKLSRISCVKVLLIGAADT
jgi:hypothetical protein